MFFSISRDYQWNVAFAAPHFKVAPGQRIKLGLAIDGDAPTIVVGYAITHDMIGIQLIPNSGLFNRFRRAYTLRLFASDVSYTFNLTGTARLLPALLECVQSALNPTPLQPLSRAVAAGGTESQRPAQTSVKEDHRAEATALLANLLSQAGVKGFQISPAPSGERAEAAWIADNLSGSLMFVGEDEIKAPREAGPILIAMAAKACKGAFMSGSLPEEAEGTLARVFTKCRLSSTETTVYYLTIKRPKGGYYVFTTAADGSEAPATEADTSIRAAALKVVPK